jgi:Tol biopolymer transport system component
MENPPGGGSVMKLERSKMKRAKLFIPMAIALGLATVTVCAAFALQNSSQHKVLFEKAKFMMETKGDLKGAIELFAEIIKKYPNEREYAAKSLYLIGICYEKLGERQAQQAQATFQRIVRDYPDQTEEVNLAKEKLLVFEKAQGPAKTGEGEIRIRRVFPFRITGPPSWDGRFFPCWDDSGDLAIVDIATGKRRRLTENASWGKGDFASVSIISPDNKWAAVSWCQDYTDQILKLINLDGSGQRILHSGKTDYRDENGYFWPVAWTPDSRHILGHLDRAKTRQLYFMAVKDGSLRTVGGVQKAERMETISLSPDGRWIAFDRLQDEPGKKYDIVLMGADGSREIPLVEHTANDRLLGWTPGSDSILMVSDRSGSWDAWIIPVKDGNAQGDPIMVKRDFGRVGVPTGPAPSGFTQDGSFYYSFNPVMEEVHVATLDMERGKLLTPPKKVAQSFEGSNCYADWSPDGKYLAFTSRRGPGSSAVCFISLDTGKQRDIFPFITGNPIRLNWHPDGKSVVVVRQGIVRVDIESGQRSPVVTEGSGFHSPRCTPDGRFVYYEEDTSWEDKVFRIMRVDLESKEKKEMYRSTQQIIRMDISPDGRSLAFLEPADSALKVMPIEGGQPQVVYRFDKGWSTSIAWSPDGKYLFYARVPEGEDKGGNIELWRIPEEGGEPVKMPLVAEGMENVRIHPDGKRIAFNTVKRKSETWVMENFLPAEIAKAKARK